MNFDKSNSADNINIYNVDKKISELTFENIDKHDKAMFLCRTGQPVNPEDRPKNQNQKVENQYEGLKAVISCQQHLLSGNCLAVVETNCRLQWNKQNKTPEEKAASPFSEEENDYNELECIYEQLNLFREEIEKAERTKSFEDDFMWEKTDHEGEKVLQLSPNFIRMQNELRETFREIYNIFIRHGIVTNKAEEDEEKTNRELEEEMIKRVVEA